MLNLERKITLNEESVNSPNLCDRLSSEDLVAIGAWCSHQYDVDKESRDRWEKRNESAMDLALQVQKTKTFPWQGASNVVFPLVTVACLQFHARAYPSIVNGRSVVNCRVFGDDPTGQLRERARRIGQYMSWQVLEQDECWEEDIDMALLLTGISGGVWKKTYFDPTLDHNVSEVVLPRDFVINYWDKSTDRVPKTHVTYLTRNVIHERVVSGIFRDVLSEEWYTGGVSGQQTTSSLRADQRQGVVEPQISEVTPFACLEQHTYLDLDGDGYAEPVIVTFEEVTKTVLRIVYRFDSMSQVMYAKDGRLLKIKATEYFTKIPFIPSPDGGIYDIGFGTLLGPLNESVNSAINQLIDSSTLSNTAGGFLARGAKIRGGIYEFSPFSWNRVDSTGDDLRKSLIPLPVREPSPVLFQLLNLLIDYTNKVSGATDMLTGVNPGQNTPAETSRSMVEQGQKIYSAIFKRIWRGLKHEFRKLYNLNALHLPEQVTFAGVPAFLKRSDFLVGSTDIAPSADPAITSDATKFTQAQIIRQAAMGNPAYNIDEAEMRFLEALQVDDVKSLYLGMAHARPIMTPQIMVQQLKNQSLQQKYEYEKMKFIATLMEQRSFNQAKIVNLYAQAALFQEQAGGEKNAAKIAEFTTTIEALKTHIETINNAIKAAQESAGEGNDPNQPQGNNQSGGVQGMARPSSNGSPTPMALGAAAAPDGGLG